MGTMAAGDHKPNAVCIPCPTQGHISPMLQLAKLLHHKGFHITFVNTEYNHKRLLKSRGLNSLDSLPDFQFQTIPNGLPPSDADTTQGITSLCESTSNNCLLPFRNLLLKLNDTSIFYGPLVTCIIADGSMSFTLEAADDFGIPVVLLWTCSACLGWMQCRSLIERGFIPLKGGPFQLETMQILLYGSQMWSLTSMKTTLYTLSILVTRLTWEKDYLEKFWRLL